MVLQYSNSENSPPNFDALQRLTWAIVQGTLLASLVVIFLNWLQRKPIATHPGHWILLINATFVPVTLVAHLILSFQINHYGDAPPAWIYTMNKIVNCLYYLTAGLAWSIVVWKDKANRSWILVYVAYLMLALLTTFVYMTAALSSYGMLNQLIFPVQFVILLLITWCVCSDLRSGKTRDWFHWLGLIVTAFAFLANPLVRLLAFLGRSAA